MQRMNGFETIGRGEAGSLSLEDVRTRVELRQGRNAVG